MMNQGLILPETPDGFCVQTGLFRVDSRSENEQLRAITERGGQIVAMWPIADAGAFRVVVAYFWPLDAKDDE